MNRINNNVIVSKKEFDTYSFNLRLRNYLNTRSYQAAIFTVVDETVGTAISTVKFGYFSGVKVHDLLVNGSSFIISKTLNTSYGIYRFFYNQLDNPRLVTQRDISVIAQQSLIINSLEKFLGAATSILSLYLASSMIYKFYFPISAVMFSLLSLDFSINGYENSVYKSARNFIKDYINMVENIKLHSLTVAINYLFTTAKIKFNSEQHIKLNNLSIKLTDTEKQQMFKFLQLLVETDEFNNSPISKQIVAARSINIISTATSKIELFRQFMLRVEDSIAGCNDHVLLVLSDIEAAIFVNLVEDNITTNTKADLVAAAEKVFYLEKIRDYAIILYKRQKYAFEGSYIEIENIFHIVLAKKYDLPVSIQHLGKSHKKYFALVTEKDIHDLELYLKKMHSKEFTNYLENWLPFKKFQRKEQVIPYDKLQVVPFENNKNICLFTRTPTDDLVYLNNNAYSYDKLKKWYIDNGTDPVSLKLMYWEDVYQVEK